MEKQSNVLFDSPTAYLVDELVNGSNKSQREISIEIGLSPKSNALTVFKRGKSPMPLSRIGPLCKSVGASEEAERNLMVTALKEYYPIVHDNLALLTEGNVTPEEMSLVKAVREAIANKSKHLDDDSRYIGIDVSKKSLEAFKSHVENYLAKEFKRK